MTARGSRTGEIVTETSMSRPSFRRRTVSKWYLARHDLLDDGSPLRVQRKGGEQIDLADDLRRRVAEDAARPWFQLVIDAVECLADDRVVRESTMAASRALCCSAPCAR